MGPGGGVWRMSSVAVGPQPQASVAPSPAVIQSLSILEMSAAELSMALRQEALDNPCLEWDDGGPLPASGDGAQEVEEGPEAAPRDDAAGDARDVGEGPAGYEPYTEPPQDANEFVQSIATRYEELLGQLRLMDLPPRVAKVAEYIIGCLDPDGYLRIELACVAAECGVSESTALRALEAVQSLEPPGIGARSLEECLELQLRARNLADPDLIGALRAWAAAVRSGTARADGTDMTQVLRCVPERLRGVLMSLDPSPGLGLGSPPPPPCELPDLVVHSVGGQLVCEVPRYPEHAVRVSGYYRDLYRQATRLDPPARAFLRERLARAAWFVKAVESRRATLLRLGDFLVERQRRAFTEGPGAIRPLSLSEAAGALGLHVSTLSRAVKGKHLWATRLGTVPLRALFPAPLKLPRRPAGPGPAGWPSGPMRPEVLEYVRRLAFTPGDGGELPSDERIARALARLGIPLSRRTVAKYRKLLGIPAARARSAETV